jgi:hypothetical protein
MPTVHSTLATSAQRRRKSRSTDAPSSAARAAFTGRPGRETAVKPP